jgi:hypothetical protein
MEQTLSGQRITMAPSEYLKRQVFVSVEPEEAAVKNVIALV